LNRVRRPPSCSMAVRVRIRPTRCRARVRETGLAPRPVSQEKAGPWSRMSMHRFAAPAQTNVERSRGVGGIVEQVEDGLFEPRIGGDGRCAAVAGNDQPAAGLRSCCMPCWRRLSSQRSAGTDSTLFSAPPRRGATGR
jgi:hypothetical protein